MAEALTYDSLVDDIQVYAERSDEPFVAQIPRFIMLAENRLALEAKGLGFLRVVDTTFTTGTANYEKPQRWRQTKSLSITNSTGIKYIYSRGYQYCRNYWPDVALTDEPEYYADYDYNHFLVVPTPDNDYPAELMYYERPTPLDSDNQTNWTTQNAPQLLLYACLLEAQPFLKLPERIQEFQGLYQQALQKLQMEDMNRLSDASSNRGQG